MRHKKIFILLGHPNADTLTGALAGAYERGALSMGHEVRRMNIGEMHFDPILHKGYRMIQELEPDLKTFQENVKWADHLVVLYPNWWSTMPALLKGLIDRAWLPGFAFGMKKSGFMKNQMWVPRLTGKSARMIVCANAYAWLERFMIGDFTNELARGTLWFAGINPVRIKVFAPSDHSSDSARARWLRQAEALGHKAI